MITLNYKTPLITLVEKGSLPKRSIITIQEIDYISDDNIVVIPSEDVTIKYTTNELASFGVNTYTRTNYIIYNKPNKDFIVDKQMIVSPNVFSEVTKGEICCDGLLYNTNISSIKMNPFRTLTDEEVVEILLNEVLYDKKPNLNSRSCVGWDEKRGLKGDINYRDGYYILCNDKGYTISWCNGTVKIWEGNNGGYYNNKGRELFVGNIDYERLQYAMFKNYVIHNYIKGEYLLDKFPDLLNVFNNEFYNKDEYKLI